MDSRPPSEDVEFLSRVPASVLPHRWSGHLVATSRGKEKPGGLVRRRLTAKTGILGQTLGAGARCAVAKAQSDRMQEWLHWGRVRVHQILHPSSEECGLSF